MAGLALSGCSTAQMSLPEELSRAELVVYPVKGRQGWPLGPITFGPYTLAELERGLTSSERVGLWGFQASRAWRPFRFVVQRPRGAPIVVTGQSEAKLVGVELGNGRWKVPLLGDGEVEITVAFTEAGRSWSLVLKGHEAEAFRLHGHLTDGRQRVEILGLRRLQGCPWEIEKEVGFYFVDNQRGLGAVETLQPGRVFFRAGLPASWHDVLAAVSGVLLMDFVEPR